MFCRGGILNSINRCIVRTGSLLALAVAVVAAPAFAADSASYVLQGKSVVFTRVESRSGHRAVAVDDPALHALLDQIGASVTWQPGDQYVLFATSQRKVISFAIGDRRYDDGPLSEQAAIAPFAEDDIPFVPLDELLRALDVGSKSTPAPLASAQPSVQYSPASTLAEVTKLDVVPSGSGTTVSLAIAGDAAYEWHRLRDDRWYLDVRNARLGAGPRDAAGNDPVQSVRLHQLNATTVRVALTLSGENAVTVTPGDGGLTIAVGSDMVDSAAPRSGSGTVGSKAQESAQATPERAPAAANPQLIVIDPGHGGSDPGSLGNGLVEKNVTLDISRRLKQILTGRGWQVILTRDGDRDVYGVGASARNELQARLNPAIENGARMFVSVHVNSFTNSGPHGTTTYYGKAIDLPLAHAIARRAARALGTADDGVVRDANLYVLHHAPMPSVIVETAFLSNPFDAQKLADPAWREKAAQAIADGIADYAGLPTDAAPSSGGSRP